ncbi:MAG: alpha/beta hydrolase [Gemmatimonas sp.]|nr:alpha/beta hydrolase [Gemmatimonas sp.]
MTSDVARVGARRLDAHSGGTALPLLALFPTAAAAIEQRFGPYTMTVAMDAPIAPSGEGLRPVALISHGNTGSPLTHRGTALALAQAGFVVLLPEHVGNSRSDASLTGTVELLRVRPQQLCDAVAALHQDALLSPHVSRTRHVLIGHSIGAYTVLAAAGGQPVNTPYDSPDNPPAQLDVAKLDGVVGLVLLAPAAGWFMPPARLAGVTAPVLLFRGEEDRVTPSFHAEILRGGLAATQLQEIPVANAGHFSFQSPFPAQMAVPGFAPAIDPPGFDRVAFHAEMNEQIVRFAVACCRG